MPPPVWVFICGTLASVLFLHLDRQYLINVPEAPLKHGLILPNFPEALRECRTCGRPWRTSSSPCC